MPVDPDPAILAAFGRQLRRSRLELGYTQERLAEESGLSARYISDVERGDRNIGLVNLDRLARALAVSLADLLGRVEADR